MQSCQRSDSGKVILLSKWTVAPKINENGFYAPITREKLIAGRKIYHLTGNRGQQNASMVDFNLMLGIAVIMQHSFLETSEFVTVCNRGLFSFTSHFTSN